MQVHVRLLIFAPWKKFTSHSPYLASFSATSISRRVRLEMPISVIG